MVGVPKRSAKKAHDEDTLPEHFYRPKNKSTKNIYVRLIPPQDLQGLPGVREFRKSTGTADARKAKPIGAQMIANKLKEWADLRASQKSPNAAATSQILSTELIEFICGRRMYLRMAIDDGGRYLGDGHTEESLAKHESVWLADVKCMESILARGRGSPHWVQTAKLMDEWCEQIGIIVERTDPLYNRLINEYVRGELEGAKLLLARNRGESVVSPSMPKLLGIQLSSMTDLYFEHKQKSVGAHSIGTAVHIWMTLIEHMGDVPLSTVTSNDLYEFLKSRMEAAEKPWSMKYAHGFVRRTLQGFFRLAKTKGLLVGPNPVDELLELPQLSEAEEAARSNPRFPFSDEQLTTIFSSEWYNASASYFKGKMDEDLGARYWGPLICMLHGNRVREVLQLVASDIGVQEGIGVIRFQEDVEGGHAELVAAGVKRSLKNGSTHRTVPLHPKLIELGFVKFVDDRRRQDGDKAILFPSSLPKPGGKTPKIGRAYEQSFLRYVRDKLQFGAGFGNHSFRHQLEDRIRAAQLPGQVWPQGLALAYAGRKQARGKDVGIIADEGSAAGYGKGFSPDVMFKFLGTLNFDRVKLPPKFEDWISLKKQ